MSQPDVAFAASKQDSGLSASANIALRGTSQGLEISISGTPSADLLRARLTELFGEGPDFFAGNTVRVTFDSALPNGAFACLEEVANRFALKLVEICKRNRPETPSPQRHETLSVKYAKKTDSVPSVSEKVEEPGGSIETGSLQTITVDGELPTAALPESRLVIGPVRSGVIVEHPGHMIVIGDVNPGAHVRATGSIVILGRLRGVAHAAIGRESGFIIALSLQPQQLRIGQVVARAADSDRSSGGAEIAYITGKTIVVERYCGRLPSGLAATM